LTSSAIETTAYQDDYSIDELESVDLSKATTKGLALSQIRYVKTKVLDINEAHGVAGNATRAAARALVDIKTDVKKKNWVALCESGALSMSSRNAQDLANAYESWLAFANIPEAILSQVSYRTLAKIGKADAQKRAKAIDAMVKNGSLSEPELNKILKKTAKKSARWDDLMKDAEVISKNKSAKEKAEGFTKLMFENIKLKQKVADLESQLKEYRAKV
tara:strand:+ start:112 stop:765 length:654 start_codon:yes stop_codon:yes gene_type:complete